ncbi:glutathione S-transferase C-terminal domain-containing protein [Streptomyces sp. NPDC001780]
MPPTTAPRTTTHPRKPAPPCPHTTPSARPTPASVPFRSRIGDDRAGGFYPAPRRYHLYLSAGCPRSLRVALTLGLLGLGDAVTTTVLTLPAEADAPGPLAGLRQAYEATRHRYDGPLTVPALCDRWSGRVVSNHTPDILRDLVDQVGDRDHDHAGRVADLRPPALLTEIEAVRALLDEDVTRAAQRACAAAARPGRDEARRTLLAALDLLEARLTRGPYAVGDHLTAADVDVWVALVHLDGVQRLHLDSGTAQDIGRYERLWAYVRRLYGHPAFEAAFRPDDMARLHRRTCDAPLSSGAAVTLPGILGPVS